MILSKYLGEDETSYLHNKLVVDDNVATAVSTSYDATSYGNGSFTFSFIPTAENKVDNVKEYFAEAVSTAIKKFNEDELKNTKNKILAGLVYAKDNPADAVGIVANMVGSGMSIEEVDSFAENIKDVKLEEVKKAAADLLKSSYVEAVAEPFATKGEKK
jgi:predicted Zn-dependent peptidase